jgi:hypothetical protein
MATHSFKLDQPFILLVPELAVVVVVCAFNFPSEPNFVKNTLSIKSKFVCSMKSPLITNPPSKRLVMLVLVWQPTMALSESEIESSK